MHRDNYSDFKNSVNPLTLFTNDWYYDIPSEESVKHTEFFAQKINTHKRAIKGVLATSRNLFMSSVLGQLFMVKKHQNFD